MPSSKKDKDEAATDETTQPQEEEASKSPEKEEGTSPAAVASGPLGQVTLSRARIERLRRRLKTKYH